MEVHKFGGASIKDATAIQNLARIVSDLPANSILVISAMGKTTNALERVVSAYCQGSEDAIALLETIKSEHFQVIADLGIGSSSLLDSINDIFVEAEWVLEDDLQDDFDYIYDQIVPVGELAATKIISSYLADCHLDNQWTDARSLIRTDERYRSAEVDWPRTEALCRRLLLPREDRIIVTQGFIGATPDNNSTTLGREGSDYSGAILASALLASSLTLWKDVTGVLDGDPKYYADAERVPCLTYEDVGLLTAFGAKVIHPKTIRPLQKGSIPLVVRPFDDPAAGGTSVSEDCNTAPPPLRIYLKGLPLLENFAHDGDLPKTDELIKLLERWLGPSYFVLFNPLRIVSAAHPNEQVSDLLAEAGWTFTAQTVDLETVLYPTNGYDPETNSVLFCHRDQEKIQVVHRSEAHTLKNPPSN